MVGRVNKRGEPRFGKPEFGEELAPFFRAAEIGEFCLELPQITTASEPSAKALGTNCLDEGVPVPDTGFIGVADIYFTLHRNEKGFAHAFLLVGIQNGSPGSHALLQHETYFAQSRQFLLRLLADRGVGTFHLPGELFHPFVESFQIGEGEFGMYDIDIVGGVDTVGNIGRYRDPRSTGRHGLSCRLPECAKGTGFPILRLGRTLYQAGYIDELDNGGNSLLGLEHG